jgi:hypothetical protein
VVGLDAVALAVLGNPAVTRDEWSSFLAVHVMPDSHRAREKTPPVLGSYKTLNDGIRFEPRFPLEPGVRYRAEFDPVQMHAVAQKHLVLCGFTRGADWAITFRTKLAAELTPPLPPSMPRTRVLDVFPTASVLPENLLRFYIHFSGPMSRGEAYARVHLLDASNVLVSDPFLELAEELWSNDGARFTLLFDPGRIKRGLKPREEVGPVLEAGKAYTLVVDGDWVDASGNPLEAGFRKSFRAGPPDETSPDPKTWTVKPPQAGGRNALEVRFLDPLDRALLDRLIGVTTDKDAPVDGQATIAGGETAWRFTPREPWRGGTYCLKIGADLEDVAGNSIARPFEVDAAGPVTARVSSAVVSLPFRIEVPAH